MEGKQVKQLRAATALLVTGFLVMASPTAMAVDQAPEVKLDAKRVALADPVTAAIEAGTIDLAQLTYDGATVPCTLTVTAITCEPTAETTEGNWTLTATDTGSGQTVSVGVVWSDEDYTPTATTPARYVTVGDAATVTLDDWAHPTRPVTVTVYIDGVATDPTPLVLDDGAGTYELVTDSNAEHDYVLEVTDGLFTKTVRVSSVTWDPSDALVSVPVVEAEEGEQLTAHLEGFSPLTVLAPRITIKRGSNTTVTETIAVNPDGTGLVEFVLNEPGTYTLTVTVPGFGNKQISQKNLTISQAPIVPDPDPTPDPTPDPVPSPEPTTWVPPTVVDPVVTDTEESVKKPKKKGNEFETTLTPVDIVSGVLDVDVPVMDTDLVNSDDDLVASPETTVELNHPEDPIDRVKNEKTSPGRTLGIIFGALAGLGGAGYWFFRNFGKDEA